MQISVPVTFDATNQTMSVSDSSLITFPQNTSDFSIVTVNGIDCITPITVALSNGYVQPEHYIQFTISDNVEEVEFDSYADITGAPYSINILVEFYSNGRTYQYSLVYDSGNAKWLNPDNTYANLSPQQWYTVKVVNNDSIKIYDKSTGTLVHSRSFTGKLSYIQLGKLHADTASYLANLVLKKTINTEAIRYANTSGIVEIWANIKNWVSAHIGNGTLKIQKNGTDVATFSANSSSNATANITVPTKVSDLTNDSGFLTSHQSLSNYVTLNTNQTLTAIKTITGGNQGKMVFTNPNYTKGDSLESGTTISRLYFGNGASYALSNAILTTDITATGITSVELGAINNTANNSNRTSLILTYDKSATRPRMLKSWGDFVPYYDDTYTLGSSTNNWKAIYGKSYYYNGTQWGLDQANTWTGRQSYGVYLKSFGEARTDEWSSNSRTNAYLLSRRDTDDVSGFLISTFRQNTTQGTAGHIYGWDLLENSTRYSGLRFSMNWNSTLNSGSGGYEITLGTNTQGTNPCNDLHITQLKTINGINPGALSLPNINYTEGNPDVYNVGTDLNNLTKNVSDPLHFSWTSPFDGWLAIMWYLRDLTPPFNVLVTSNSNATFSKFSQTWSASSTRWLLATTFPVVKNVTYYFNIDFQNTTIGVVHHAYLLPCLGNV